MEIYQEDVGTLVTTKNLDGSHSGFPQRPPPPSPIPLHIHFVLARVISLPSCNCATVEETKDAHKDAHNSHFHHDHRLAQHKTRPPTDGGKTSTGLFNPKV